MSNEPETMKKDPPANSNNAQPTVSPDVPQTPEQVMQAASARIADLEAELAEMKDRWMRAEAETANVRARSHREVNETRQYAVQKFAQDVVETAENLHRGLESLPPPAHGEPAIVASLREGLEGIERNFLNVMERNGVKREDPTGTQFDPNLHQAMAEQESAAHPAGSVMHAWTPVWTLNGRLLRPAMVVVAKAPPGEIGASSGAAKLDTTA
ncbi:MAG TPA: nucleotide exchange factor GrpE [Acetobacteraceae bacterium]|jgi:molecular chaperone GrpE|nr:nucleotide exchange factor GrpE [Acetobacteraceae bacterium]